jgi:hypothetical protein
MLNHLASASQQRSAPVTMMYSMTPQHHTSEQEPSKKLCMSASGAV